MHIRQILTIQEAHIYLALLKDEFLEPDNCYKSEKMIFEYICLLNDDESDDVWNDYEPYYLSDDDKLIFCDMIRNAYYIIKDDDRYKYKYISHLHNNMDIIYKNVIDEVYDITHHYHTLTNIPFGKHFGPQHVIDRYSK